MSESSTRSDNSTYSSPRPYCNHGACYLQRSFTPYNPGRRFWRCPLGDKPGDCGYFIWYEDPFEGRAKAALLDCIRKSHIRVQKEKKEAEEKIEEVKDGLETKIKKIRAENKSLKQVLKETKCRLHCMHFLLIVTDLILVILIFVDKVQFLQPSRYRLPN